ncbi:DUF2933 domain-containing protein [Polaromonas sp.]|uniref:DUF2933 domain-containing protein n=1 Tax=Polaromonas sp. TaxID=1869339 RepID=UPI002FC85FD7
MNHDQDHDRHDVEPRGFWRSRYAIGLLALGAIAAYFLLREHRAHVFGALPYLLLLACPLIHLFMHHGHGHHRPGAGPGKPDQPNQGEPS